MPLTDPAKQQEVVSRLAGIFKAVSAPPETVLNFFDRIGLKYELVENVPGDNNFDTIAIKMVDIHEADKRILAQGSLLQRVYGADGQKVNPPEEFEVKSFGSDETIARHRAGEETTHENFDEATEFNLGAQGV